MFEFKILKKSKVSRARLGVLKTSHGEIETPSLVPVATQAAVKTLTSEEVLGTQTQILIANTFHLHLKPGEKVVKSAGGLHSFMNWPRPLMTDSGGFQVFSLGFGRDLKIGKLLKYFPDKNQEFIQKNATPKSLKITPDGVYFRSPIEGKKLFLGPKESIKIQQDLGADIIFTFDECTAPLSSYEYAKTALERTHRWAKTCLEVKKSKQAIFGIIQGSKFKDLREKSARFINEQSFEEFGIGGDLGENKQTMQKILDWTIPHLTERKPRHLLGIGYLEDMEMIIKNGVDLFDCTVPTHYARRGIAFTSFGKIDLGKEIFLKDKNPLDQNCTCSVCQNYRRTYLSHLIRAKEMTGLKLLTFHNLCFFNNFVTSLRKKIKDGKI
ncbi:tRNA guanosine(34) transglycosylase Tgt [Candidatus Microgenomates bacterium]|nr:tRNA guanosine(34) transglycosylase Tgt [Candidatus Microgenomates bacterium]